MNTNDYPNRDALRKANDIYLDVMRSFIFRCLDLIPGETAESIIKTHIGHDSDYPIKDAIDFDDIPFLFRTYWNNSFELHFNRVDPYYEARSAVQLIVEGRNRSSHPPWDLDPEFTRTHLFIIAELLGKVNRLDKQDEVEAIRDELLFDDAAKQISALSEKYDAEKAEKKKYKNELTETKQRLVELKNEQTSYKERIEALTDVEKEKKDVEERLATISKEHKEVEEAWSECDECLTTTRNQLKEEKNANNSLKERLESIEKQFKEVEKEKKNHKDSLASIKKQLAAAKSEKMDTERHLASMRNLLTTVAIDNQIFPPLSTDSAVRILDRRNTDKKNYLLNLLELKQPSIIYVQGEQKINQFLTHVAPEKAEVIGIHNEHTSDAEERVLLEKLENGDLIAIVSNAIFSTLPQLHCVEHFVFCHHVLGVEGFFKRCHPAFTSSQNTYLHLIYDHKQDFQEFEDLVQKYPDRHTLEKLYTELKDHIEVSENFVKPEKYYNEVGVVKQEFETSFAIFAELRLLDRNEEGIKLLHPSGKKLEESKIYCIGEKLKKEIEHFDNSQLTQSIEQIWDNILVNVNVDINKFTHEQDNNIFEVKDNSQTTTGYVTDNSNPSNAYMWPQRTISSFNILRKYAAIIISESKTLLREENKKLFGSARIRFASQ